MSRRYRSSWDAGEERSLADSGLSPVDCGVLSTHMVMTTGPETHVNTDSTSQCTESPHSRSHRPVFGCVMLLILLFTVSNSGWLIINVICDIPDLPFRFHFYPKMEHFPPVILNFDL